MRILYFVFVLFVGLVFASSTFAQESTPRITITTPLEDSIISNSVTLNFSVENFTLTASPIFDNRHGVAAIYVDGKFFTTTATNSASIYFPRTGTHFVEVELNNARRLPIVPRVTSIRQVHVQKKTPYVGFENLRQDSNVYTSRPTVSLNTQYGSYEDQQGYFQVFVDGEVDGDSRELSNLSQYTLQKPLTPGAHSLRVAWYKQDGRLYSPVIDSTVRINYSAEAPTIASTGLLTESLLDDPLPYSALLTAFRVPEDGYLELKYGDRTEIKDSVDGVLPQLGIGKREVTYSLLDRNGFPLVPAVSRHEFISISPNSPDPQEDRKLGSAIGMFFYPEDRGIIRLDLLYLAAVQAIIIIFLGFVYVHRHHRHER